MRRWANGLRGTRTAAWWSLAVAIVGATLISCANDPFDPDSLPNKPPIAQIWILAAEPDTINPTSYNDATFFWSGTDPDGFVEGYHVSIGSGATPPTDWIFTTNDESTATYATDSNGEAFPRLYVVAEDDRGALSDTVSATVPLKNFPPVLEFIPDFTPLRQTFAAASFELLGFDLDGNETLLPYVEYRFEGSDPGRVFDIGDPLADPALGWVRLDVSPTRFSLALRDIPAGDPANNFEQTLYIRILDEASAPAAFSHTWSVFEVVGDVLLIDDNAKDNDSRDQFYRDALDTFLPGAYSVWNITDGLPEREEDVRLTLAQFNLLIWYTGNGESAHLPGIQGVLTDFVEGDFDPDTPGVQSGQLYLEMPILAGNKSSLSSAFRGGVLGINAGTDPRNTLESYFRAQSTIGDLEITAQVTPLPDLLAVGENYLMDGSGGIYFDLVGLVPEPDAAALWRFEQYIWGGDRDTTCRAPGCEPIVAVRRPATGTAKVVSLGFQLEYANAAGTAIETVGTLLRDHLGRNVATP